MILNKIDNSTCHILSSWSFHHESNSQQGGILALFHPDIWRQQIVAALFYWGVVPFLVLAPGFLLDRLLHLPRLPSSALIICAALVLLLTGGALIWWSTIDLQKRGGGTPSPLRPAKRLVTDGSYGICRHPMFLGYDLLLLAVVLFIRSPAALFISYPLYLLWSLHWLKKEERVLQLRFKDRYRRYQQEVPFLIPRPRRKSKP